MGAKYIYNNEGQLVRVFSLSPQYHYEPDSNCFVINGIMDYTYDRNGFLKTVKETFDFSKNYWYITRFKWRFYRKE